MRLFSVISRTLVGGGGDLPTAPANWAREDLDMATEKKLSKRNWISSSSSTKQRHNVKAKIDITQQKIKCWLYGDRVGWLVGWVLWHINLCWLFNAKFIFM